jgi:hypothetical protein
MICIYRVLVWLSCLYTLAYTNLNNIFMWLGHSRAVKWGTVLGLEFRCQYECHVFSILCISLVFYWKTNPSANKFSIFFPHVGIGKIRLDRQVRTILVGCIFGVIFNLESIS